jgi:hypothetical protein
MNIKFNGDLKNGETHLRILEKSLHLKPFLRIDQYF